jgi:hypothetical protein
MIIGDVKDVDDHLHSQKGQSDNAEQDVGDLEVSAPEQSLRRSCRGIRSACRVVGEDFAGLDVHGELVVVAEAEWRDRRQRQRGWGLWE